MTGFDRKQLINLIRRAVEWRNKDRRGTGTGRSKEATAALRRFRYHVKKLGFDPITSMHIHVGAVEIADLAIRGDLIIPPVSPHATPPPTSAPGARSISGRRASIRNPPTFLSPPLACRSRPRQQ